MPTRHETDLPHHLMGIWPHPDDEAYLSAGLMARMTDAGRRVTVVTLTRGEKGTSDPADFDQPHFAARRERELRASLAELGVDDVRVLDYRDGECDLVDNEEAIAAITEQIDALRPDTLITFGPDGITGHRDHRIVSAWVTEAWRRVGHGELLYATMSDEFVARNTELHERIGLFAEQVDGPASCPTDQLALTCDLADDELDRKRRALGEHASQTGPLAALMGEDTYRTWWRTEWFRRPSQQEAATCGVLCPPITNARPHVDEVPA